MLKLDFTIIVRSDDAEIADLLREVKDIFSRRLTPVEVVERPIQSPIPPYQVGDLRERIMVLLEEHSPRTVMELARLTGRTDDAIRRQAPRLERQGKIRIEQHLGRGGTRLHAI